MTKPRPPLAAGYYLDNFETLLAETTRAYGDLLSETERRFVSEFAALPRDGRRLYVRLLGRRGPWLRRDRLRYAEIDCEIAVEALLASGFAGAAREDQAAERLASLSLGEMRALLDEPGARIDSVFRRASSAAARQELEDCVSAALDATELARRVRLLRLERTATVRFLQLLFFGNLRQDLREFVLADLGVLRFEAVAIDGRSFPSRAAAEEHLRLHAALEELLALGSGAEAEALLVAAAAAVLGAVHPANQRLRDAVLNLVGRERERAGRLDEALELYAASRTPPARERRVRILAGRGRSDEAAALRREMSAAPRDESERLFAERGPRGPRRRQPPSRELLLAPAPAGEAIETRSLAALAAEGYRGFFAENWLWRTLFGLAFWDIVFAPLAGAFVHRFQYGPRDLHDGFRAAREPAIAARLEALRGQSRPGPALLDAWQRKFGIANRLVTFAEALRPHLELATSVLDGARLASVCDRLSRDLRRYGSGFPDLFLVDARGEILLAEVKGPGDTLRPDQDAWIGYLNACGLPALVVHAVERCAAERARSRRTADRREVRS